MNWTGQQEATLREIREWLSDKNKQVFRLFGYAGTGKTTLTKEIAAMVDGSVLFGAFTGKAASVLRRKGCDDARTIHSMIYALKRVNEGEPEFVLNSDSDVKRVRLVVIDECSMVDETIGRDLLSFGVKVLVIGDPAQLPPVKGAGFFTEHEPDVLLTEVHRQAEGNPIIALSMMIRNGDSLKIGDFGESKVIARKDVNAEMILGSEQVIVGLNRTRESYNNRMRVLLGHEGRAPKADDKLICLRNDRKLGLFNGTMWRVDSSLPARQGRYDLDVSPLDEQVPSVAISVRKEFFEGGDDKLDWKQKRGTQEFTFGYAITCHKSQGSQWDNITVFDESAYFRESSARWLYTAVTRAAERLTLVLPG